MKISFVLFAFFLLPSFGHCQQHDSTEIIQQQKKALLAKSRLQKTVGWIMFGTGMPFVLGCTYILANYDNTDISISDVRRVLVLSIVYTAVSIPLIIAGKKNKAKALSLQLTGLRMAAPGKAFAFHSMVQPALGLKLRF